jgi:hypothetical protein
MSGFYDSGFRIVPAKSLLDPAKQEPYRNAIQRRDAEIAEISAEKKKQARQKEKEFGLFLVGFLCAHLCDLCVSALKNMPRLVPGFVPP